MMKFLFMMIFMMFLFKDFWLVYYMMVIMSILLMFNYSFSYNFMNISYYLGCDLLSFTMVFLSLWICLLMILASSKIYFDSFYYELFIFLVMIMFIFLFMTFSSMNFFIFYLFFEMSMVPMVILIMGWGYQPERLQAGVYLLFYTLFMSLPMMISIFYYYYLFNSLLFIGKYNLINNLYLFLCMNMVFLVKMPMFMLHLWLPKAHVEAPVAGSMILAGVLLKLGGYGLMRLMSMFISIAFKLNFIFITISVVGSFMISMICLRQTDIKALIAYSSIAHMSLVLGGIMTLNCWGMYGALVMMVAHGLCSSGLFCLANIVYERLLSRSLFLNKGLMNLMPSMAFWWFLLCCCNMSSPSLNLLGEILLVNSLICWSKLCIIFLSLILFFSVGYSMYLYSYTQHGQMFSSLYVFSTGYIREYLLLFLHLFPLIFLIFKSESFMLWI